MKRKVFFPSLLVAGALAFGFQVAQAQETPPTNGTTPDNNVPIEQQLTKVCVSSGEMNPTQPPSAQQQTPQQGVVVFLPGTTNLVTLSAYSSFCSVPQDQALLSDCQCSSTSQP